VRGYPSGERQWYVLALRKLGESTLTSAPPCMPDIKGQRIRRQNQGIVVRNETNESWTSRALVSTHKLRDQEKKKKRKKTGEDLLL